MWLSPEKSYTVQELEPIFATLALALEAEQHFFFVFEHADFLPPACANRLLKPIEEPPPGYHFLLLAQRKNLVLPTIQSRCVLKTFAATASSSAHKELLHHFTTTDRHVPATFARDLDAAQLDERASAELLDALVFHWHDQLQQSVKSADTMLNKQAQHTLCVLKKAADHPPMPGSSKLFWRNLFLQFMQGE